MHSWFLLSPLALVNHHVALHKYLIPNGSRPTFSLLRRLQHSEPHRHHHASLLNVRGRARPSIALSAQRERRTTTNIIDNASTDDAQQLISDEEAARSKRVGQAKRRLEKGARRENRIFHLENLDVRSDAECAELDGLLRTSENFEEQYDSNTFSVEHVEFKRLHNEAFVALARYCQRDRKKCEDAVVTADDCEKDPSVFYLDGPDASTSSILIEKHGFDPSCCYVANRHISTVQILQQRLPEENVIHATAAEALTPNNDASFSNVDFAAYYFDGCGGFTPHVIGMMTAALIRPGQQAHHPKTTAVGYSLMGGNRDVVEKELEICRALTTIARTRGMRTRHVLDDPGRYGVPSEISKTERGTFTSWMLLEEE